MYVDSCINKWGIWNKKKGQLEDYFLVVVVVVVACEAKIIAAGGLEYLLVALERFHEENGDDCDCKGQQTTEMVELAANMAIDQKMYILCPQSPAPLKDGDQATWFLYRAQ